MVRYITHPPPLFKKNWKGKPPQLNFLKLFFKQFCIFHKLLPGQLGGHMRPFSFQPPPISSLTSWAEHHITSYPEQSIISWATYHILSRASYHNYICHIKYINTVVVAVPTCNRVILVRYSPNLQHVLSKPANQNAESNHFLPCQIRGLQSANTKLFSRSFNSFCVFDNFLQNNFKITQLVWQNFFLSHADITGEIKTPSHGQDFPKKLAEIS